MSKVLKNTRILTILGLCFVPFLQGSEVAGEGEVSDYGASILRSPEDGSWREDSPLSKKKRRPKTVRSVQDRAADLLVGTLQDDRKGFSFQSSDLGQIETVHPWKQRQKVSYGNNLNIRRLDHKKRCRRGHSVARKKSKGFLNPEKSENVPTTTEKGSSLSQEIVKSTFKTTFKDCLMACYRIFKPFKIGENGEISCNRAQENLSEAEKMEAQQQSLQAMKDLAGAINELVWLISTDGSGVFVSLSGTHEFELFKKGLKNQIAPGRWILRERLGPEVYDEILSLCKSFEIYLEP